ncbi:hypothetical protein C8R44DRAFT_769783 [Mycena epipterygia]|nr:hypothetical protein C8R44DRAFT_769783 [Mycena epipterygia]
MHTVTHTEIQEIIKADVGIEGDHILHSTGRKKAKPPPRLSNEVKSLLGAGNQAYINGDLTEARRIMLEVIRIEPRAPPAWWVLARCYEDRNQEHQGLKLRVIAAHLTDDPEDWDYLAQHSKKLGCNLQALYCLGKLMRRDPSDVGVQWERASLAREIGDLWTTRHAFLAILKRFPHDLAVLSEIRTVLVEIPDFATCTTLFKDAFEHYQKLYPSGHPTTTTDRDVFGQMQIFVLADLYNTQGDYGRAIDVIRQAFRWLQGRAEDRYWDMCDDDREYDQAGFNRVVKSGLEPGMFPLDVNSRHRLAIARIKMGDAEEGKLHAIAILSEDIIDYAPLFVEIAEAYFEEEMYAEALEVYELLGAEASTSSFHVILQTAACLRMLNELREAAELYEQIRLWDPSHDEAKMRLAEIYEILNEPRKALELVYEVIGSRSSQWIRSHEISTKHSSPSQLPSASLFFEDKTPKPRRALNRKAPTLESLKEMELTMERDNLNNFRRITELWPAMLEGGIEGAEQDWLLHAGKMIDGFRETRQLFSIIASYRGMFPGRNPPLPKDQEAGVDRMASRLQLQLRRSATSTEIFRGVHFSDWLGIFFQYCFILTKGGQFDSAHDILCHIIHSTAYRSQDSETRIRMAIITCAIAARRCCVVVEQCKKIMASHRFKNEPLRILLAAVGSGLPSTDAFMYPPLQKVVCREMKYSPSISDESPKGNTSPSTRSTFSMPKTEGVNEEGNVGQGDGINNTVVHPIPEAAHMNPVMTAVYAEMCSISKQYQSAIFHFLRAYELSPDPMICLCLAIAYMGRATNRHCDNRHYLITQGMAFLTRYRQLRQEQPGGVGEVEFNFGRAFQGLGLYSHAVTHYEKVLELEATDSENTVIQEAAYNLSLIYVITGATPLADAIYRRWLTF